MITRLYSLFDRSAVAFGNPIVAINDAMVRRSLSEFLETDQSRSDLSKYSGDFDVFWIGEFDTLTGVIKVGNPTMVCKVSDLLRPATGDLNG
jgi:hypothetical protein